jgi:hypothetical protein
MPARKKDSLPRYRVVRFGAGSLSGVEQIVEAASMLEAAEPACGEPLTETENLGQLRAEVSEPCGLSVRKRLFYRK